MDKKNFIFIILMKNRIQAMFFNIYVIFNKMAYYMYIHVCNNLFD